MAIQFLERPYSGTAILKKFRGGARYPVCRSLLELLEIVEPLLNCVSNAEREDVPADPEIDGPLKNRLKESIWSISELGLSRDNQRVLMVGLDRWMQKHTAILQKEVTR